MALLAFVGCGAAGAGELQPFVSGSAEEIRATHAGRPYILALWSLNCAHCADELALFGKLLKEKPGMTLVLVSTDSPDEQPALVTRIRQHGLEKAEQWVFADDIADRLRHELDPRWQGELPRSYLVEYDGSVRAISGRLEASDLRSWLKRQ